MALISSVSQIRFEFRTFEYVRNGASQESFRFLGSLQFDHFAAISQYLSRCSLILQYFSVYYRLCIILYDIVSDDRFSVFYECMPLLISHPFNVFLNLLG
jgi:hypothetical protein